MNKTKFTDMRHGRDRSRAWWSLLYLLDHNSNMLRIAWALEFLLVMPKLGSELWTGLDHVLKKP